MTEKRAYPNHGGRLIGKILKEHGIKYVFGVQGGHLWPLETGFYDYGVERIHMRHEQTGVYAAEAYARLTRSPGICYGTAGPGFTNMVTGIAQAYYNKSPLVVLAGKHAVAESLGNAFQEAYPVDIAKSITRWSISVEQWQNIPLFLRRALYECMTPPPRPILLAMDPPALMVVPEGMAPLGDVPHTAPERSTRPAADPKAVEQVVTWLIEAERPVIVAGDGVWWSDAANELRELVELLNVPVSGRRMARGAVAEDHRLAISPSFRLAFWKDADLVVSVGLNIGTLEGLGAPPVWPAKARRVVINDSAEESWQPFMPTDYRVTADSKLVLRQMIECARTLVKQTPKRAQWLGWLDTCKRTFNEWKAASAAEYANHKPVHAMNLCQDIAEFLDDSATFVHDSFIGSHFFNERAVPKYAGQILDGGPWGGVGQGIGMGIGAQLARPGKQVLVLMGDGGMGIGAMDIETAARYKLPIVYVVVNNSDWMCGIYDRCFANAAYSWKMTEGCRYDTMFEAVGCHGENVDDPKDIKPALDRAFKSGKTAVVNVNVDPRVSHPFLSSWGMLAMIHRCVDMSKLTDPVWAEFYDKGPIPEVIEKLRQQGCPLPLPQKKGMDKMDHFTGFREG